MVPDEQHGQVPRTGGDKGQRSGLEDPPKCGGCAWWAGGVRLLKIMTNLDSIFKSRDITFPTKVRLVKAMVFPVVMYGCVPGPTQEETCIPHCNSRILPQLEKNHVGPTAIS